MSNFDISRDWISKRLGELSSSIQYGYTAKAQQENVGPKLLRITDIQEGTVDWDKVPTCRINESEKNKYLLSKGDLVFARTGATVGKSYLITGAIPEAVFASYLIRVRLREEIDPKYVSYFFKSPEYWRQISENQAGIGQPNVNGKKLSQLLVPVAPPEQQKQIVAEIEKQFSRLDEAVANLKRVKANLKRYKAAVLKAAVEGKLTEEWRKAHPDVEPASELLKRILAERRAKWNRKGKYKEPSAPDTTNLPSLPEGWKWVTVDQLAEVGSGNTPAQISSHLRAEGPIPWFKVADMNRLDNQRVMRSAEGYLSKESVEELGLKLFPPGTIIFPKRGGAIATNKKRQLQGDATTDLNVMGLKPHSHVAGYLWWWFCSVDLSSLSDGSNVPQVNNKDVLPLTLPLPPVAEQEQIVADVERRLSVVEEFEAQVAANLQRAERLRQSILSRAFCGRLVSGDGALDLSNYLESQAHAN